MSVKTLAGALASLIALSMAGTVFAQTTAVQDPDARAKATVAQMSFEEKFMLLHGIMPLPVLPGTSDIPPGVDIAAGYVPGIERLGVPALRETDASLGVAYVMGLRKTADGKPDGATALPSGLALASTWNPELAYEGGAMIGAEARDKGFNVLLGGGLNLTRDPRNGRNFEYLGEDPLLSGTLAGEAVRGTQSQQVISTVKHYANNGQETGRQTANAIISEANARESELLAFQFAIERGNPGAVMCAYNPVNNVESCSSDELLNLTLKRDWHFKGWVMSDWGAVEGVKAAFGGLDQQSGEQLDTGLYFDKPLKELAQKDPKVLQRVNEMNQRILRSMYALGVVDNPVVKRPIDFAKNAQVAKAVAQEGIVLLKNDKGLLPLAKGAKSIAVIGGYADAGVISGGGSSQVAGPNGPGTTVRVGGSGAMGAFSNEYYHDSAPLAAIEAANKGGKRVSYDNGFFPQRAAEAAKAADVAIVFVTKWEIEGQDSPDLSLPRGQDMLIEAVASANPNTIVVLETGNPIAMPWLSKVGTLLQAWYAGAKGGEAIGDVLFGSINPSGRLPITYPAAIAQLPRQKIDAPPPAAASAEAMAAASVFGPPAQVFDVDYNIDGSDVGYRWYARNNFQPLFAFGYGLSYTTFNYSNLKVEGGETLKVSFDITNTGKITGKEVGQVYLTASPKRTQQRLLGFEKVELQPGETRHVSVVADKRLLANWDSKAHGWQLDAGIYHIAVGMSAMDLKLQESAKVSGGKLKP